MANFFKSWKSHWTVGYLYGLTLCVLPRKKAEKRIVKLDIWGWEREVKQHDPDLSPHQIQEAKAWGQGARKARRVNPPLPSPPYPKEA